jgi:hypothetical protein
MGRGTPLGNNFNTGNRLQDIADFREWLWDAIRTPYPKPCIELQRLYDLWQANGKLVLVCSCKPKACHTDVIKSALLWMYKIRTKGGE